MSIAPYIKEIGRGKEGARSLSTAQAHDVMSQVLDGSVSDLEIGAFAIAMRIKGETTEELAGFLTAVQERCIPLPTYPPRISMPTAGDGRLPATIAQTNAGSPAVVLPSYNGARKLPNLTGLLALFLAQEGIPVLVHGPAHDPGRVTTGDIFHDLGLPIARTGDDIAHAWARREPVFIATEALCPPLARLLDVRWVIGLRNPGHTVAKLLDPTPHTAALRIVNYTHPEYGTALSAFVQHTRANALLLRGTEGEPVADARRLPRLDVFINGALRPELSLAAQEGILTELPVLPRNIDAATTAVYIQSVISGEKPAPAPVARQVDCIRRALVEMNHSSTEELIA